MQDKSGNNGGPFEMHYCDLNYVVRRLLFMSPAWK